MIMFVSQQLVVESLSTLHRILIKTAPTSPSHMRSPLDNSWRRAARRFVTPAIRLDHTPLLRSLQRSNIRTRVSNFAALQSV